jgi:hypothetical protein
VTPTKGQRVDREEWSARRGNLAVVSKLWTRAIDLKKRVERIGMTFDVYTPTKQFRIADEMEHRTYTARQMRRLLAGVPELETVETYDFVYDIHDPITIAPETEDVVFVLRKK